MPPINILKLITYLLFHIILIKMDLFGPFLLKLFHNLNLKSLIKLYYNFIYNQYCIEF